MFADLTKDLPNTVKIIHAPKSGGAEALTNLQESDCRRDVIQKVSISLLSSFNHLLLVLLWDTIDATLSTFLRILI